MEQVNFDYVGDDGFTIYRQCFEKYTRSRFLLKRQESQWSKLVTETEVFFEILVAMGIKHGYNVNSILEIPDQRGETCFDIASRFSDKICNNIINRGVNVNSIRTDMMVRDFRNPKLAIQMMKMGMNPHIIDCNGKSQIDYYPSSFNNEEAKRLLATFPRSIHYSIEDIECPSSCPVECLSKFKKFVIKNGSLVEMTDQKRIGSGGFGIVFRELFHGKPMAMKCMPMGKIIKRDFVSETVSDVEKNISELRIQIATIGSGVIAPIGFVRQQNQEKDFNGKWIAKNYNIYIYPLYDCNLDELHGNYRAHFTEAIIGEIIHQCFIRTGSAQLFMRFFK